MLFVFGLFQGSKSRNKTIVVHGSLSVEDIVSKLQSEIDTGWLSQCWWVPAIENVWSNWQWFQDWTDNWQHEIDNDWLNR